MPSGSRLLPETMLTRSMVPYGVTRPQWVKRFQLGEPVNSCGDIFNHFMTFKLCRQSIHWGREKVATILQTTFWNAFSSMKKSEFWLKFHCSSSVQFQFSGILDAGPCWTSVSRSLVGFPMGEKEHGIMVFPYAERGATYLLVRVVIPVRFG